MELPEAAAGCRGSHGAAAASAPAHLYVAHKWGAPFAHLVSLLSAHLAGCDPSTTYLWLVRARGGGALGRAGGLC